ncbi:SRPBCC family protein [Halobacillus sp. B29]|uniref:SRPBCC family protein n=1 Tax=Halobacillus sp. B29 TaxID=3457432 RepID=UPI003FCD1C4C
MEWKEERTIEANIETVWNLFREENMLVIMPKVIENEPVHIEEGGVGSKYRQKYQEGKRVETYIVETVGYEDTDEKKFKQLNFTLAKAFDITFSFTLEKVTESTTRFIYEGNNRGVNFVGRAFMKLGSKKNNQKVVNDFKDRVEEEALKEEART